MTRRVVGSKSLVVGIVLAASAAYLAALLFGLVFNIGGIRRHHVESASYIFAAAALIAVFTRSRPGLVRLPTNTSPWLPAGFIAASALLYGNTVSLGMFSDDFVLAQKALAGEWLPQPSLIRPLPLVVWNLLLAITNSPAALHILNVCLHGLNAALVCLLAVRMGLPLNGSIIAGVLFLAFPGSVEAVVWPAAVHDLIVTACALGFLLLAGRRVTPIRIVLGMGVLILALLSKESAVAIPLLALVVWLDLKSPRQTPGWPIPVAGIVVCMAYGALRMALVTIPGSFAQEPTRYLAKELIARPIGALTLPWTSTVFGSWPLIPFLWAVTCVAGMAIYAWRGNDVAAPATIARCLIAVIVAVLPVYSILFITPDLENARYLYLSTAFWVVALVGLAGPSGRLTSAPMLILMSAVVVGVVGVQIHLASWREAARLRERVLSSAADVLGAAPCKTVSFGGAPDSVRGAYVFRNGLSEAIAMRTNAVPADPIDGCAYVWDGSGSFQKILSLSGGAQASFLRRGR